MTLSKQLRELLTEFEADPTPSKCFELSKFIYDAQETILSALELQERLDQPETVEVVARALNSAVISGNHQGTEFSYKFLRDELDFYLGSQHDEYVDGLAQAAINALKGGAA